LRNYQIYRHIIRSATLICALFAFAAPSAAQDFDLVILNGRVMDPETRYDAVANVGVKDVVKDAQVLKGVNPGRPIRYEPEKSRFEPITVENWTQTFYAAPMDFGGGVPGHQPRKTGAPDLHPDTHGH
jgi:hypothetical protein